MASLALAFDILAKDRGASDTFRKVGNSADDAGKKGERFGKLLKVGVAAGAAVAGAAAVGLFSVLKNGASEFASNQTAAAQFEAGLKSTGNVAGITTKQMTALADAIEAKTGTDGAAVVAGGALLATFTKVRNEVGKGNDVFNRATQAGVDLAARGFGSVEGNAVLLGKALNDPLKGLTALGKQGITFTADQKKLIKSLVETGDTLGAQKIILKEVEGQVGGSAEAYGKTLPGQIARAKHAFDGISETVFKAVLPAVNGLLGVVNDKLIPAFGKHIAPAIKTVVIALSAFIDAVREGDVTSDGLVGRFEQVGDFIHRVLIPAFRTVATFVVDRVLPVFRDIAGFMADKVIPTVKRLAEDISKGLGQAFTSIGEKIEENRPQLQSLVDGFKVVAGFIVEKVIPLLGPILGEAFRVQGQVIGTYISVIGGIVRAFTAVKDGVLSAVDFSLQTMSRFLGGLQSVATAAGALPGPLGAPFRAAATAIGDAKGKVDALRTTINNTAGKNVTVNAQIIGTEQARDLRRYIEEIKSKTVTVTVIGKNLGGLTPVQSDRVGRRASGGPVSAGRPYLVGEREPELFVPSVSGQILNQRQMARAGGGGGSIIHITTTATDPVQLAILLKRMEALNG